MHGPLRRTNIHRADAQLRREQRAYGGAAGAIVAHHELLETQNPPRSGGVVGLLSMIMVLMDPYG